MRKSDEGEVKAIDLTKFSEDAGDSFFYLISYLLSFVFCSPFVSRK